MKETKEQVLENNLNFVLFMLLVATEKYAINYM